MRLLGWHVPLTAALAAGFALLALTEANAHVRVKPAESKPGVTETYQVTVPTEGKVSTLRVELVMPEGVELVSVADAEAPHEVRKDASGATVIIWRGEILAGFAKQYIFTARNPRTGSQVSWVAHQYFADGTVADWADVPGSKRPASVTKLVTAP